MAIKKCQRVNINLTNPGAAAATAAAAASRKPSPGVTRKNPDEKWDPRALEEALLAAKLTSPNEAQSATGGGASLKKSKERIKVQRSRTIHTINTTNLMEAGGRLKKLGSSNPPSPLRGSASMTALYSLGRQLQTKVPVQ